MAALRPAQFGLRPWASPVCRSEPVPDRRVPGPNWTTRWDKSSPPCASWLRRRSPARGGVFLPSRECRAAALAEFCQRSKHARLIGLAVRSPAARPGRRGRRSKLAGHVTRGENNRTQGASLTALRAGIGVSIETGGWLGVCTAGSNAMLHPHSDTPLKSTRLGNAPSINAARGRRSGQSRPAGASRRWAAGRLTRAVLTVPSPARRGPPCSRAVCTYERHPWGVKYSWSGVSFPVSDVTSLASNPRAAAPP